jgi:3-oxoacyl-[acyl-carrier protein] reductase
MPTRTCVITGASRGIGLATALRFAQSGCNIVAAARHAPALEDAVAQIRAGGAACEPVALDVARPADARRLIELAVRRFGRLDVLVNNAGYAVLKPLDQMSPQEFDQTTAINVAAVFHTTQAAWPIMKAQRAGVIINVSSLSSIDPFPGFAVYGASKAWVNLFSQATGAEGRQFGIRVYAVAPGAVETTMLRSIAPDLPPEHTLAPDEVAAVITKLCDEDLAPVSGQTIFVRKS